MGMCVCVWGGGPLVIDSEDAGATVIAVVARRLLISPCPGIAMGVRTMVVVTVQGAPDEIKFQSGSQILCHRRTADAHKVLLFSGACHARGKYRMRNA